jgi:hypothetical protein
MCQSIWCTVVCALQNSVLWQEFILVDWTISLQPMRQIGVTAYRHTGTSKTGHISSTCFIIEKFVDRSPLQLLIINLRCRYVRLPNLTTRDAKKVELCRILNSHTDGYEEVCLLGYYAAYVDFQRTT